MKSTTVSLTGAGTSVALPLDVYSDGVGVGLYAKVTGTVAFSIEVTPDNVQDPTITPTWFPCLVPALTGATQTSNGLLQIPCIAARINMATGTGTVVLIALDQGVH